MAGALAVAAVLGGGGIACGPAPRPESAEGLYRLFCARCHGDDGRGTRAQLESYPKADLLLSEAIARGDRAAVLRRTAEGYGPMPAFRDKLSAEELDQVTDFVLALAAPPDGGATGAEAAVPSPGGGAWIPSD